MKWDLRGAARRHEDGGASSQRALPPPGFEVIGADTHHAGSDERTIVPEMRVDPLLSVKVDIHRELLERVNLPALEHYGRDELAGELGGLIAEILEERNLALNRAERIALVEDVIDELVGLGPLEPLLKDETINDILVNGHETVFVERFGMLERVPTRFQDERHLLRIIQKIVNAVGRRVDESSPFVDARLADGSRVHAIVAPLAIDGSLLSIRKFSKRPISMDRMIELESISADMAAVLQGCVKARMNIIISGGTGSGKTTMLNALSSYIDERERIVTIEDSAELQLQQGHVARLETRPPNIEGRGGIEQRELVRNALRMRPDRIILGECRAGEAFDMLQAMNTGHDGSMTTVHANTPRDALARIEQMVGMSGIDISPRSTRGQIASAINLVIQIGRLADGKRKVISISEIVGMEGDTIVMQEIFRFHQTGRDETGRVMGQFEATGIRPRFANLLHTHGIDLPTDLFRPTGG